MPDDVLKIFAEGRTDTQALSKFVNGDEDDVVKRRLNSDIKTLSHYIRDILRIDSELAIIGNEALDKVEKTTTLLSNTTNRLGLIRLMSTSSLGTVDIDGISQKTVGQMVYEALDASVLPDGVVTDSEIVVASRYSGGKTRTQSDINSDTVHVDGFIADLDDPSTHSAGFQAAHDALYALGGGTVHLGPRKYYIQGVKFGRGVRWLGAGTDSTIIKPIANPVANLGLFTVVDNEPKSLTGIGFYEMTIEGNATASGYRPIGATVNGIDFGTNLSDAEINQCYFVNVYFSLCKIGLNMVRSVRFAPIIGCRFWTNDLGLFVGNEHPVLVNNDFRYNNVGMDGIAQDMDMTNTRFSYNRVGCQVEMSRSALVNCKFWQNEIAGITNLREYNVLTGCLFRGAGTFWQNVNGSTNESIMIGLVSRGTKISSSLFFGGNGLSKPMIEFSSSVDQHSFTINSNMFLVDSGHVIDKVGTGAISGLTISGNSFYVTSIGDGNGAMGIRIPNMSGAVAYSIFSGNYIRNQSVVQTHDFIEMLQSNAGGQQVTNNIFHAHSGVSGGVYILDSSSNIIKDNTFREFGSGTFLNKIKLDNKRSGLIVKDNVGFLTEKSGEATIASGSTSVTVNHGLDLAPLRSGISVTSYAGMGNANKYWVSNYTETSFTINVDVAPTTTAATFIWSINAHKFSP